VTPLDRSRATVFGSEALKYDRARPSYPSELLDALVTLDVHSVLDVGCGTGIAARAFAARGCRVRGVEADVRMAEVARGHGIDVDVARFEDWSWHGPPFDMAIAAQSWHWVDPALGPVRVASVLRPGGRFAAFWNSYEHAPRVVDGFRAIYSRVAPHLWAESVALGTISADAAAASAGADCDALAACGAFEPAERQTFTWRRHYSCAQWLDELPTHSGHRALPEPVLAQVLEEVAEFIDAAGGRLDVGLRTSAIVARRRMPAPRANGGTESLSGD
jgi:SAM-dependent methyltransferase